jgi:hypothetical protein
MECDEEPAVPGKRMSLPPANEDRKRHAGRKSDEAFGKT